MKKIKKLNLRIYLLLIFLIIVFFLIAPRSYLDPARNILYQAVKPASLISSVTVDKISFFFRNLFSLRSISTQNQTLIKENLDLQAQLAILKEVRHENEILKKEMGFLNSKGDLKLVPANIIGRTLTGYLKTIIIDRGSEDGLKVNQAVVSQGFLIGTVRNVYQNTAEVILVTDNNSLVPVVLQDSRGTGLLRGGLNGLTVEDIPLNIPIKQSEQVITSGLGGDIPPGIITGTVQEVVSKEGEIFQKVTVKSPIQTYYLEFVFIIQ